MSERQAEPDWMRGVRALVGKEYGRVYAWDEVNAPMIRQLCEALGDENPVYIDPDFAAKSVHGGLVAPPTMLQVWTMRGVATGDWSARKHAHNGAVVHSYARSPGIMRCMVQLGDEQPEFGELWRASYHRRLELLARAMPRLFPDAKLSGAQAHLVTTMLGGIGEHLLSEYYIVRAPALREMGLDEAEMTEWISVMFYRALFLENPPPERLKHAALVAQLQGRKSKQTTPDREDALS